MTGKKVLLTVMIIILVMAAGLDVNFYDRGRVKQKSTREYVNTTVRIEIWDHATAGTKLYTKDGTATNGRWNIAVGPVELEYGKQYWKEYTIGGEDADFNGAERQPFYALHGGIKTGYLITDATADLVVDTAAHRVGINKASPGSTLDVDGTVAISGDIAVNTDKVSITASNGNTAIAGTLTVDIVNEKTGAAGVTIEGALIKDSAFDTNVATAGVTLAGTTLAADGTDTNINIAITPKGSGEVDITKVDIDAGTIDGATIATSDITVGSGKTLDVYAGTLTLANDQISGDKVSGGTIGTVTISQLAGALNANNQDITNVDIDSGTIDGATIATSDITVGSGKTLDVSAGTFTLANDQISGDKVSGGTIGSVTSITSTTVLGTTFDTNVAAAGVTLTGTTLAADGSDTNINIAITPKGSGEVDITKVDIDAGTINGATIAASDITVGPGKTLDVSAGTLTLTNDQISGDKVSGGTIGGVTAIYATTFDTNVAAAGVTLTGATLAADGSDTNINIAITPKGSGEVDITKVDIDAGTIDGATIAASDITVGSGKTLDVSAGTLTLANDQISGDKVSGGTIGAVTIGQLSGALNANSQAITNVNIDSGNIDGATIATSDITVGAGKTLDVSAGTLTLANDQISGDKVQGGTIASTTITTLSSDSVDRGAAGTLALGGSTATAVDISKASVMTTVKGTLNVDQAVTFDNSLVVNGTVTLGDADGDSTIVEGTLTTGHSSAKLQVTPYVQINNGLAAVGSVTLGNDDNDVATVEGKLDSGHSSGLLQINDGVTISETLGVTGVTTTTGGLKMKRLSGSITDGVPTDAEIDAITASTPSGVGAGWIAQITDSDGGATEFIVWSDGTNWWYEEGTKAL